jgi:hypothetical protein
MYVGMSKEVPSIDGGFKGDNPMLVKGCFYCLEVLCGSY